MKRALKRMKIQQFLKKNRTAQNFYDKSLGALDLGYNAGMGLAQTALAPELLASKMGRGMYTGMGEYVPDSNDLISKSSMAIVPEFGATDDDSIIIRRREYVCEIFGPDYISGSSGPVSPFVLQSFPINPGLERTFPWLSQIAQNYDEYELIQCIFTFKSTTTESNNSGNGQVGTVILATNYNAAAPEFRDKATMQRYMGAISSRLTESVLHGVECDPLKLSGSTGDYVRTNPVVTGQDVKTYDHGKFQIAIANASSEYANFSLGELWVSYTVKLRKSKFFTSLGFGITRDIFVSNGNENGQCILGNTWFPETGIPYLMLYGQQNNLGCKLSYPLPSPDGRVFVTFPAAYSGYIEIKLTMNGANISPLATGIAIGNWLNPTSRTGNVRPVNDLYGTESGIADDPSSIVQGNSGTSMILLIHVKVEIATNGIDNVAIIPSLLNWPGPSISQTYVEVSEYNAVGAGLNQGVSTSDAPIFVNAGGIVVIPAASP